MQIQELADFVCNYTSALNVPGFGYSVETSQTSQAVEVSFYSTEETPDLVILIDNDNYRVARSGEFEELQTQVYHTKLELFQFLTQTFIGVVTEYSPLELLSLLLGGKIVSWKSYVARIFSGLPLEVVRTGEQLVINGENTYHLQVSDGEVQFNSSLNARVKYTDFTDLFVAITSFLTYVFVSEGLDITLFDSDDSLIVEDNSSESADSPASNFDIDIDAPDIGVTTGGTDDISIPTGTDTDEEQTEFDLQAE